MERLGQSVRLAADGNFVFLHGLKQGGLRARAGAVDFIGHKKLRKHRTFDEAEGAPPGSVFLKDFRAQNVGRHQVRRALDAVGGKPENLRQRFHQQGFGHTWNADQQDMPAGHERNQGLVDHRILPENHLADLGAGLDEFCGGFGKIFLNIFCGFVHLSPPCVESGLSL